MAMSRHFCLSQCGGRGVWHLAGRGRGGAKPPENTGKCTTKNYSIDVTSAKNEKLWSRRRDWILMSLQDRM